MVAVRVSHDDPANRFFGSRKDALHVVRIVGAGIEHCDLAVTQQVGVRTGAGHETWISGENTPHARREDLRLTWNHCSRCFIKFFGVRPTAHQARPFYRTSVSVSELGPILT